MDTGDPIVEAVKKKLDERSLVGQKKYGTTLAGNPLLMTEWLNHLQTELLDAANYCEAILRKCEERGSAERPPGDQGVARD